MPLKVLVIGAGLGGLTLGIALRRHGITVEVHEAAREIERTGAGLTLGLGAQHVFRALGLQDRIAAKACPAGALPFLHFRTGKVLLGALDRGDGLPDDGATNLVRHIYRADLQDVLVAAFAESGGTLRTGHRLDGSEARAEDITAHFADGTSASADLLVGADGVRSVVRERMFPGDAARFTGHVAYRFLVPRERAEPFLSHGRSAIYIGPGRTFNRYTMAQGRVVNVAALVESGERAPEGWSNAALGAAMAVEDGWVLAEALAREADIDTALARYEATRLPRTAEVHRRSAEQGRITQALDPDAFALAGAPVNDRAMMEFDPVAAGV